MDHGFDRADVLDLLARQSHAIDDGDAEGWAATYTADGTFHSPTYGDPVTGREHLVAFARSVHAQLTADGIQQRHFSSNTVIDLAAGVARTYVMIVRIEKDAAPTVLRHVVAHDELAIEDGAVRVRHRRIARDG